MKTLYSHFLQISAWHRFSGELGRCNRREEDFYSQQDPPVSYLHMLLLTALLRFMLLSAHEGAIRNKDPINPSDVSTGITALGYCSRQIKNKHVMYVCFLFEVRGKVNFDCCVFYNPHAWNMIKPHDMTSTQDGWNVSHPHSAIAQC